MNVNIYLVKYMFNRQVENVAVSVFRS